MERVLRYFDRDRLGKELGIQLVEIQPGQATARMTITEKHHNGIGIAHGEAIFTLADIAFAAASNSHGTIAVGVNASIAYLKAVSSGTVTAGSARSASAVSRPPTSSR